MLVANYFPKMMVKASGYLAAGGSRQVQGLQASLLD
jgi:hypothetical protein